MKKIKKIFIVVFITAITVTVLLSVSCSKKTSSYSNDVNISEYEWGVIATDVSFNFSENVTTTSECTTACIETSVTEYVASALTSGSNNSRLSTTTLSNDGNLVKEDVNTSESRKIVANNQEYTTTTAARKEETIKTQPVSRITENKVITTSAKKENTGVLTTTIKATEAVSRQEKFVPNLYVEVSPEFNNNSLVLSETDGEVFVASTTLWFQNNAELKSVENVLNALDCEKVCSNSAINFNDYINKNSIEEGKKAKYFASVLLFESANAIHLQINENSFPDIGDFFDNSNTLLENNQNLILTNNSKNALIIYVYANTYSQSITLSLYATHA